MFRALNGSTVFRVCGVLLSLLYSFLLFFGEFLGLQGREEPVRGLGWNSGLGFRVQGSGFRVSVLPFRILVAQSHITIRTPFFGWLLH